MLRSKYYIVEGTIYTSYFRGNGAELIQHDSFSTIVIAGCRWQAKRKILKRNYLYGGKAFISKITKL